MHVKLMLIGVIVIIIISMLLITGKFVSFLLLIKSAVTFGIQLIIGLFLIWLVGQISLFVWMKIEMLRGRLKKKKKIKRKVPAGMTFRTAQRPAA